MENACVKDAKKSSISVGFQHGLSQQFADIKYNISLILLHCIVLQNDESLKESLSFTQSIKDSGKKFWRNAYYKNQQLNNVVNNIIMKYLLRDNALKNSKFDKLDPLSLIYVDASTK